MKRSIADILYDAVRERSRDQKVALLLSGGVDSQSVGFCLNRLGKKVAAYSFELEDHRSRDCERAQSVAEALGWRFHRITIPTTALADDFIRLAVEFNCRKKVHFETAFPNLYAFPVIAEREVWCGLGADGYYGVSAQATREQSALKKEGATPRKRKAVFDDRRREYYATYVAGGGTYPLAIRMAKHFGKKLLTPYLDYEVFEFFIQFSWDQLNVPKQKHHLRSAFDEFEQIPPNSTARHLKYQLGAGVDKAFERLLTDPRIAVFQKKDGTPYNRVTDLCQAWSKAIDASPEKHARISRKLKCRPEPAITVFHTRSPYRPYSMAAVRRASSKELFSVVSMFAGGGGSSIGYQLAGGKVRLVNEFVKEAVRTYRSNFPDTIVDDRDIRKVNGIKEDGHHTGPVRFIEQVGLKPKQLDILDGSPPCKSFSQAGRGQKSRHERVAYSDTCQSGVDTLFYDFFYLAKRVLPKVIVAENVPSLANTTNRSLFEEFLSSMRHFRHLSDRSQDLLAYYANYTVLDASLFGAPQKRNRLFVIGIRKDVAHKVGIRSHEAVARVFPESPNTIVNIRAAFDGLDQSESEIDQWRAGMRESFLLHPTMQLPSNPFKTVKLPSKDKYFQLQRPAWDRPCPTLAQQGQKLRGTSGVIHPEQNRKFTLSELKRLFALPDDYVTTGTVDQGAERICRMVCPLVSKAIAESIYHKVLLPYRTATKRTSFRGGPKF